VRRGLSRALTRGISIEVASNRAARVRGTVYVDHRVARLLGLRPARANTHEDFIVGRMYTRAASGRRRLTFRLSDRARYAMARYDHRFAVYVLAQVDSVDGSSRTVWRRVVLPGNVR
jgi:hypothetical protein